MKPKVIIVGGGLTGLSVAWRLAEQHIPFLLIEKEPRLGGQIRTRREGGYTFEVGPNTGTISFPEVVELFRYLAPLASLEVADKAAKRRLILKKGTLHPLPSSLWGGITTPLFSFHDKLKVATELFRPRGNNPYESVGELAERRLGRSVVRYAVDPFVGGVYAGDPYQLTARFALPKLYALEQEYGSFIKGAMHKAFAKKSERDRDATKEVFSVSGGLENMVSALTSRVSASGTLLTGTDITAVRKLPFGWEVHYKTSQQEEERVEASYLVTTVRADQLRAVLPTDFAPYLAPIESLRYAPVWELAVGFDQYQGFSLPAFGALIPSVENRGILGILFPSDCFKNRTPSRASRLFTIFIGGDRDYSRYAEASDEQIVNQAVAELYKALAIPQHIKPSLLHLSFFPKAIPQYERSSEERFARIAELEKMHQGLFLAGGIRDGIGMAHRIKQGSDIGLQIARELNEAGMK